MTHLENEDDPLDFPAPVTELSSLHASRADAEWDALVSRIMSGAAPELTRRREERGFVRSILRWARPVGIAAAIVLCAGTIGLAMTNDAEAMSTTSATPSFAEVVDREPASTLLAADRPPSATDVESALERESFQQVQP